MMMTTRTIAGHTLSLVPGVRYYASRPWATRGRKSFDVTIAAIDNAKVATVKITGLSYDGANAVINAFNDGATSFEGRVW